MQTETPKCPDIEHSPTICNDLETQGLLANMDVIDDGKTGITDRLDDLYNNDAQCEFRGCI